jgi:hypothetical protein
MLLILVSERLPFCVTQLVLFHLVLCFSGTNIKQLTLMWSHIQFCPLVYSVLGKCSVTVLYLDFLNIMYHSSNCHTPYGWHTQPLMYLPIHLFIHLCSLLKWVFYLNTWSISLFWMYKDRYIWNIHHSGIEYLIQTCLNLTHCCYFTQNETYNWCINTYHKPCKM